MADEETDKGSLTKAFNFVVKVALVTIPIAFAANFFWGFALGPIIDPSYFLWTHDLTNPVPQAMALKMDPLKDFFLWALGLEGDGPMSGAMTTWLEPEINQILAERTVPEETLQEFGNQLFNDPKFG